MLTDLQKDGWNSLVQHLLVTERKHTALRAAAGAAEAGCYGADILLREEIEAADKARTEAREAIERELTCMSYEVQTRW